MILFFQYSPGIIIAAGTHSKISEKDISKLKWLFGNAELIKKESLS